MIHGYRCLLVAVVRARLVPSYLPCTLPHFLLPLRLVGWLPFYRGSPVLYLLPLCVGYCARACGWLLLLLRCLYLPWQHIYLCRALPAFALRAGLPLPPCRLAAPLPPLHVCAFVVVRCLYGLVCAALVAALPHAAFRTITLVPCPTLAHLPFTFVTYVLWLPWLVGSYWFGWFLVLAFAFTFFYFTAYVGWFLLTFNLQQRVLLTRLQLPVDCRLLYARVVRTYCTVPHPTAWLLFYPPFPPRFKRYPITLPSFPVRRAPCATYFTLLALAALVLVLACVRALYLVLTQRGSWLIRTIATRIIPLVCVYCVPFLPLPLRRRAPCCLAHCVVLVTLVLYLVVGLVTCGSPWLLYLRFPFVGSCLACVVAAVAYLLHLPLCPHAHVTLVPPLPRYATVARFNAARVALRCRARMPAALPFTWFLPCIYFLTALYYYLTCYYALYAFGSLVIWLVCCFAVPFTFIWLVPVRPSYLHISAFPSFNILRSSCIALVLVKYGLFYCLPLCPSSGSYLTIVLGSFPLPYLLLLPPYLYIPYGSVLYSYWFPFLPIMLLVRLMHDSLYLICRFRYLVFGLLLLLLLLAFIVTCWFLPYLPLYVLAL